MANQETMNQRPREDEYSSGEYYDETSQDEPTKQQQLQRRQRLQRRPQQQQQQFQQSPDAYGRAVQPYSQSGPPATSAMDGTVTRAQMMRGEVDRQQNPGEADQQMQKPEKEEDTGLKLRLDLNLDIDVELKAKIHGDLTLSLL